MNLPFFNPWAWVFGVEALETIFPRRVIKPDPPPNARGPDLSQWGAEPMAAIPNEPPDNMIREQVALHQARDEVIAAHRLVWAMLQRYGDGGEVTLTYADLCEFSAESSLEVNRWPNGEIHLKAT